MFDDRSSGAVLGVSRMSIKWHFRLYVFAFLVFFVAGVGAAFLGFVRLRNAAPYRQYLVLALAVVCAAAMHRLIFHHLLAARCPACREKCFPITAASWEIVYRCAACGHLHRTGVFQEGSGD